MRGFEENNCRLCKKTFCCKKCRLKHEVNLHNINPICDLCVYGLFSFENLDEEYLGHIRTTHLPLNCVNCKRVFNSVEDILQHKKCLNLKHREDSPKTPFKPGSTPTLISDDQNSPILQEQQRVEALNYIFTLATSTPMHRGQEPVIFLEKIKEPFTPDVNSQLTNKSIIKKIGSGKSDRSSQRRVTFGETTNSSDRSMVLETKGKKFVKLEDDGSHFSNKKHSDFPVTPGMGNSELYSANSEQFVSAKSEISPATSEAGSTKGPLCEGFTPAVPADPLSNSVNESMTKSSEISSKKSNILKSDSPTQVSPTVVPSIIAIKPSESAHLNQEDVTHNFPVEEAVQEKKDDSDKENLVAEDATQNATFEVVEGKTLWLTATNLDNTKDQDENNKPEATEDCDKRSDFSDFSPKPNRRVSIVMPTPIFKKTDVQMKFHIPAHLASTPIMSNGMIKLKHTKIVEEMSARVINQQTPFKTPRGEITKFTFRNLDTYSGIQAGPSSTKNDLMPLSDITEYHSGIDNQPTGVSVSSMTEASLWTSMTRMVKSVFRFSSASEDSSMSAKSNSISYKRHLSDSDECENFLEAPRLKRFKFTDIKCRRPIRDLPALEAPQRVSKVYPAFEIVKSVTTVVGGPKRVIQCDKSTQTDDFLMYGWVPRN